MLFDRTGDIYPETQSGVTLRECERYWRARYRLSAVPDSISSHADSLHKEDHSLRKGNDSLYNEELSAIAAPAQKQQRLSPKEMEKIVLDLCKDRWLTRNQIATLVCHNSESLRQRYLNPMVEHGLLRLRFPEKPNRTDQAYTTVMRMPDGFTGEVKRLLRSCATE